MSHPLDCGLRSRKAGRGGELLRHSPVEPREAGRRARAAHVDDLAGREELHVRDRVDAGQDAVLDGLGRARVRDGAPLQRVRGVHRRAELVDGVGGEVRDSTARPAAGGDHLDDVGALRDQEPDLAADLVQGVGHAPAPVEMAAAVRDGAPRELEPRAREVTAPDRLPDREHRPAPRRAVADRRHPRPEVEGELAHRGQREELVGIGEARLEVATVRGQGGVGVNVHHARHHGLAPEVAHRHVEGAEGAGRPDRGDAPALHADDRVGHRRAAAAVDQRAGGDRERAIPVSWAWPTVLTRRL